MGRIIPEGYCCLGVLCELAAAEIVVERHVEQCGVYYSSQRDWLPVEVVNWAGLKSGNPSVNELQLSVYNDRGASFTIIADLIEKHL